MPNSSTAGTPALNAASASRTNSSGESWHTPGMASMGRRNLRPLRTNSGNTSDAASRLVSRTSRRKAADLRSRRGRYAGNDPHELIGDSLVWLAAQQRQKSQTEDQLLKALKRVVIS